MEEIRLDGATASDLIGWRPPLGVLSVYLDGDPADRSGRWRIELRNGLRHAVETAGHSDRETRAAVQATAARLEQALADAAELPARGLITFAETSRERAEERTFELQMRPRRTEAFHGARPWLGPLVELADDGAPLGIAAVGGERVRLVHWSMGRVEELHDWGLELYLSDWRERKAKRPTVRPSATPVAPASATSASGRDQHNQRMAANREQFAHKAGELAQVSARNLGWQRVLVFGDERYVRRFADGFANGCELKVVDSSDLVAQPTRMIVERVEAILPELRNERERALIERLDEGAYANGRTAFGRQATMQALETGRVDHLVYDSRLPALEVEQMIELAVPSSAAVTAVGEDPASGLEAHDGVAALLRY